MNRQARTLRDARTNASVSLRTLAKRLKVAPSTLSRVETGVERASDRIVDGYIEALGLDRDETYRRLKRVPRDVLVALTSLPGGFERVRSGLSDEDDAGDPSVDPDIAAIESLLDTEGIRDEERETFESLLDLLTSGKLERLTSKQRARLVRVRRRVGDLDDGPANLFSSLTPDEQRRQRDEAKRVVLPWENEGYETPHKLPQR